MFFPQRKKSRSDTTSSQDDMHVPLPGMNKSIIRQEDLRTFITTGILPGFDSLHVQKYRVNNLEPYTGVQAIDGVAASTYKPMVTMSRDQEPLFGVKSKFKSPYYSSSSDVEEEYDFAENDSRKKRERESTVVDIVKNYLKKYDYFNIKLNEDSKLVICSFDMKGENINNVYGVEDFDDGNLSCVELLLKGYVLTAYVDLKEAVMKIGYYSHTSKFVEEYSEEINTFDYFSTKDVAEMSGVVKRHSVYKTKATKETKKVTEKPRLDQSSSANEVFSQSDVTKPIVAKRGQVEATIQKVTSSNRITRSMTRQDEDGETRKVGSITGAIKSLIGKKT